MEELVILRGSHEGKEVPMDGRVHVRLSDGVYQKSDKAFVVRIEGKYYRKNSPLIVELNEALYGPERFVLKDNAITTITDKIILPEDSVTIRTLDESVKGDVVIKNGIIHHREHIPMYVVTLPSSFSDPFRVFCSGENELTDRGFVRSARDGRYYHKDYVIELDPIYGEASFYPVSSKSETKDKLIKNGRIVEIDGSLFLPATIEWTYDPSGNKHKAIRARHNLSVKTFDNRENPSFIMTDTSSIVNYMKEFIEKAKSYEDEKIPHTKLRNLAREYMSAVVKHKPRQFEVDSEFSAGLFPSDLGIEFSTKDHAIIANSFASQVKDLFKSYQPKLKGIMDSSWFMDKAVQPYPELWNNPEIQDTGGDYVFWRGKAKGISISSDTRLTGGIGYTFGVELETSHGVLPRLCVGQLGLDAVGDRSIGSLEYVTEPLHGNNGMLKLMKQTEILGKYCTVDDRCGIHVHVGGADGAETPLFNRAFSVRAIMLGCQIEKDLFSLLPDNRMSRTTSGGLSYCGSILSFSDTDHKNGRASLSNFVIGHPDGFKQDSFKDDAPTPDLERGEALNRWATTRYKWLNLINCNTFNGNRRGGTGGFKTIEFRAFNGSLDKDDLRAFVLISLSFVRFIEKFPKDIDAGGVSLVQMVSNTLNQESLVFILDWMSSKRSTILEVRKSITKTTKSEPLAF